MRGWPDGRPRFFAFRARNVQVEGEYQKQKKRIDGQIHYISDASSTLGKHRRQKHKERHIER